MSTQVQTTRPNSTPAKADKSNAEYFIKPFGGDKVIKLTIAIVKHAIATKTRSGRECSDRDAFRFIQMCAAKGLNPWEGDAYLIGYDTNVGGQTVGQFSQVVAIQALLKRAEVHPEYDGMQSGVLVLNEDGSGVTEIEGDFHLPTQKVVGAWAIVHFKTRKFPAKARVRLERFQKGFGEWVKDPAGMCTKCARAAALRLAFPNQLGGMYLNDEFSFSDAIDVEATTIDESKLLALMPTQAEAEAAEPQPADQPATDAPDAEAEPPKETKAKKAKATPQVELEQAILAEKLSFGQFIAWALETEAIAGADSIPDFASVPTADAERLLRGKTQLIINVRNFETK